MGGVPAGASATIRCFSVRRPPPPNRVFVHGVQVLTRRLPCQCPHSPSCPLPLLGPPRQETSEGLKTDWEFPSGSAELQVAFRLPLPPCKAVVPRFCSEGKAGFTRSFRLSPWRHRVGGSATAGPGPPGRPGSDVMTASGIVTSLPWVPAGALTDPCLPALETGPLRAEQPTLVEATLTFTGRSVPTTAWKGPLFDCASPMASEGKGNRRSVSPETTSRQFEPSRSCRC